MTPQRVPRLGLLRPVGEFEPCTVRRATHTAQLILYLYSCLKSVCGVQQYNTVSYTVDR